MDAWEASLLVGLLVDVWEASLLVGLLVLLDPPAPALVPPSRAAPAHSHVTPSVCLLARHAPGCVCGEIWCRRAAPDVKALSALCIYENLLARRELPIDYITGL